MLQQAYLKLCAVQRYPPVHTTQCGVLATNACELKFSPCTDGTVRSLCSPQEKDPTGRGEASRTAAANADACRCADHEDDDDAPWWQHGWEVHKQTDHSSQKTEWSWATGCCGAGSKQRATSVAGPTAAAALHYALGIQGSRHAAGHHPPSRCSSSRFECRGAGAIDPMT